MDALRHRPKGRAALTRAGLLALTLCLGLGLLGCPKPPPPEPPPAPKPAKPSLPAQPIPKEQYLKGWVTIELTEVFLGTSPHRSALHWMANARFRNQGNRTINKVEVEFEVAATGYKERVVVLDVLEEHTPLEPSSSWEMPVSVAPLERGVVGPVDPAKPEATPPPTVKATIVDLSFADEASGG